MSGLLTQEEPHTCGYVALHNWLILSGERVPTNLRAATRVDELRGVLPGRLRKLMRRTCPNAEYYRGSLSHLRDNCFPVVAMVDDGYADPHWVVVVREHQVLKVVDGLKLSADQLLRPESVLMSITSEQAETGQTGLTALLKTVPNVLSVWSRYLKPV